MLIVICGPMKSGKSLSLIDHMSRQAHSNRRVTMIQPAKNTRDEKVVSRAGVEVSGRKVRTLTDVDINDFDVIAIDEAFMFDLDDIEAIRQWLLANKTVIVSTLDMSATGKLMPMYAQLLRLGPEQVIHRQAICEVCRDRDATFTQICHNGQPMADAPTIVVDDEHNQYTYRAACRMCNFSTLAK